MIAATLLRAALPVTRFNLAADAAGGTFRLTSLDIQPGGTIADEQAFDGMGCNGQNVSPALAWSGAPQATKSYALLLHDPDAPTGGAGWWHWVVINLPASASGLAKGAGKADGTALPSGATSIATDYGVQGYGGPCPPEGDPPHRYIFTVYALKVEKLDVPKDATASLAGFMINANAIARASFTGMFGR